MVIILSKWLNVYVAILILKQAGIVLHSSGVVNDRLHCIFSCVITVLPGEEDSDLKLDKSYNIFVAIGEQQGVLTL